MSISAADMQTLYEVDTMQNEEDEDEESRECGVCGDLAKGYHFNALTCEGCKGFFRRAIKRSVQLNCPFLNKCTITKNNRRSCQACRFHRCQAIGMRKEMVMSEKAVLERRSRIKKKKMQNAFTQLSSQQEEKIQELLCGHRSTFDSSFSRFTGFRPIDRDILTDGELNLSHPLTNYPTELSPGKSSADPTTSLHTCSSSSTSFGYSDNHKGDGNRRVYTALPHMADLTTYMIKDIISFSKSLQDFRSLSIEDQIALLKGATFEIMLIRFNMVFNSTTKKWECGQITYCINDVVRAGFQLSFIEPIYKFHHTLRKLDLQEEEYVIIQAMSLFSPDRPGVQQHGVIDRVHENLALTLKTWIDCKRTGPDKHLLFPKVIACFTEMRTIAEEYSKQILQIQDIQPNTISPLIMEVVSNNTSCDF
ncbi:nuclear receptor subfamily 1 group I member 2 [Melanotaenia boesemani]|uniref:nuclear receptor subfamily 1 group I member 2 n=1 Tax=Melanotaenia boesemani TaxID=1250792 RepID=UPI001C049F32|nr:nuclear receptor subfamily 1 group I member 2 [Melanotaenia boesemani]XP_041857487.1 nuclear receptor subfamily 1 group I member 2 [Melanotaenia boesemani]